MNGMLVKYTFNKNNHVDPNFSYLTYGESGQKGKQILNNITKGFYIFFHNSFDKKAYITAYFCVEKVLTIHENQLEINTLPTDSKGDEIVVLGNRKSSKILTFPILFDKKLVLKLRSLGIFQKRFTKGQTELQVISSATRTHRVLSSEDVGLLLDDCMYHG